MKPNPLLRTVSFLACLLGSSWASAATFSVNSYVDSVDVTPGNGVCADSAGRCTLRAAILEANALAGADTILAPPGVYSMTLGGANEDLGLTGDMDIRSDVTIIGLGTTRLESQVGRVIHVITGNATITGLTLVNGDANNDIGSGKAGGAVHVAAGATMTLNNCTVIQNTGQGGGGGIFNGGTLTLNTSTMTVNSALGTSAGGAVLNAGTMTITNSTLSGNSATAGGGAIFSAAGSTLVMNNVTISNNSTSGGSDGGGISINAAATATLSNTILANNQASGTAEDCLGAITSLGGNLVEVPIGCTGLGANDIINIDPVLGPLQDNGGRTFTHALLAGSPALNAGGFTPCELTDQRGLSRPQGPACDIGAFELFPNCPAVTVNPATLPDGDPGVFYTQTVTATGGVAPYTFSITSGSLPAGLALNSTTGVISGVPTTVAVFNFTVTAFDANFCRGSRTYTVVIGNPCNGVTIILAPTSLPDGTQAQAYSQQVTATGGAAPYQYTVTAGALPPGLTLNLTTGVISGTPTASGTYFFAVTATDANLCTGSQAYVITIACSLDVQPATLAAGTEGVAYNQTMTAANGTPPYTFAVSSGSLPPGLTLTGAGVLSGTPTAPGTYTFVIQATDANSCTGARGYTLVINPCLVVSPASLPNGTVGTAYSQQLTGTGGTPPITFAVSSGTLPAGLTLSASGLISGTPATGGISLFTVAASAAGGCVVSQDYYIVVNAPSCPAITVTPAVLPNGQVGQNYNQNLGASGGNGPYTFTFLTGDLPAGLTLSVGGNLSGTPIESGVFTFTVAATDSNGCTGTRTITLSVTPTNCPLVALFPSSLPNVQVGVAYSQTITATGGAAPYAYTVSAGSLPPGLSLNATSGVVSGTPTTSGAYSFTIRATDTALCFGARNYTLNVTAGVFAAALVLQSDATGVWEPAEAVTLAPSWTNGSQIDITAVTGTLSTTNATITLTDTSASYGTIAAGDTVSCADSGDCYGATAVGPRPGIHWDAFATEVLSTANSKSWRLHIGNSFTDVSTSSGFYRFIETLLHYAVTGGCGGTNYCPTASTTREQMAVFVLVAKEGAGYAPPACTTPVFSDVPASSGFCRFIEELARRAVVGGCGGSNYCPTAPVTREQMAVFVLRVVDPALTPPACTVPLFADVPASSGFCRWIEELARRAVVTGCGGVNYCPTAPVTREQMGVFISVTFGLTLYGP
jgi:CSLREA domain-containing protein